MRGALLLCGGHAVSALNLCAHGVPRNVMTDHRLKRGCEPQLLRKSEATRWGVLIDHGRH